jgi:hypothetical protein
MRHYSKTLPFSFIKEPHSEAKPNKKNVRYLTTQHESFIYVFTCAAAEE